MTSALLFLGGLVVLLAGAELLVSGGTGLALRLGVRPIVVGLTVVSIGTSMPELAIGIDAARTGSPELAAGNIIGTNLVNLLLILGLSALLVPLAFEPRTLRFDLPAMTAASLVLYVLALDGMLGRVDGLLLCAGAIAYTWGVLRSSRPDADAQPTARAPTEAPGWSQRPLWATLGLVGGIAIIWIGAELLVEGAVQGARTLGVSDAVVGLTVVAIGTSAPELATTVLSTLRGDRDIAIGNLLGSSVYNIALVLGITVLVAPRGIPVSSELVGADLLLLAAAVLASIPAFLSGQKMNRIEGGTFVAAYVGYLVWLVLTRT